MTTYDNVVRAAQRLLTDDTKDTWSLADAVLAHVPNQGTGGRPGTSPLAGGGFRPTDEQLTDTIAQMKSDGVTTPNGDAYTSSSLKHLRDAAMSWPEDERHPEAAYRTHQEAGSPRTDGGKALAALCAVARGEKVTRPRGLDLKAWDEACDRVRDRKRGFLVAANDVRTALKRKTNVPGRRRAKKDILQDVENAITSGDLDFDELLEMLPPVLSTGQTREEWLEERLERVRQNTAAGEEGMNDEELDASDEEVRGLQQQTSALGTKADEMAQDALGGKALQYARAANREASFSITFARREGIPSDDMEPFLEAARELRHKADLMEMAATGQGFSAKDEDWLREAGVA